VYELLVGCPPFYDKSKSNTEARIVSGVPHFPPTISEAAKNFICAGMWPAASLVTCQPTALPDTKGRCIHLTAAHQSYAPNPKVSSLQHQPARGSKTCLCLPCLSCDCAALRKNPEERPTVLDMVHHPWVDLYRMRRSMRQIPLAAGAPTAATSSFTNSQVAAAAAAAGAAIGAANVSASCPALANLSQLLQTSPLGAGQQGSKDAAAGASSSEQQGPMSAAAAAAAALNAVKKNIKQTVAIKMIPGTLQGKPVEQGKLGSKEDLHAQLSSASSPCLLAGKPRGPTTLLKAAMAGNLAAPPAAAAAPLTPTAMSPAALAPPAPLVKGGSLKLDADARTFLFASAFGPGGAPGTDKPPAGALASASPVPVAVPKQHAGVLGGAPKVPGPLQSFRAAQH
jgi:hypothetical protein